MPAPDSPPGQRPPYNGRFQSRQEVSALNTSIARSAALGLLLACAPLTAAANMVIDRAIVAFKPGDTPRQDVMVMNAGKEPLFVQVEVLEVQNPGTDAETRVAVKNPEEVALLATPLRLMVEPGGKRPLRLVNLRPQSTQERVYRVNLSPVVGKIGAAADANAMAVKVVVGYQLLVLVSPAEPQEGLEVKRDGKVAVLRNAGNTNILLFSGQQCPAPDADEASCKGLPDRRLYPGNEWRLELPFDQPFDYQLTILERNQKRSFD